jgi:hypothetical protein
MAQKRQNSSFAVSTNLQKQLFSTFPPASFSYFNFLLKETKTIAKMHMQGQDWNEVVLRKKHTTTSQATSSAAVNAALRSGMVARMHL